MGGREPGGLTHLLGRTGCLRGRDRWMARHAALSQVRAGESSESIFPTRRFRPLLPLTEKIGMRADVSLESRLTLTLSPMGRGNRTLRRCRDQGKGPR